MSDSHTWVTKKKRINEQKDKEQKELLKEYEKDKKDVEPVQEHIPRLGD